jgi:hypothetical protein
MGIYLDRIGFVNEANYLDKIILKASDDNSDEEEYLKELEEAFSYDDGGFDAEHLLEAQRGNCGRFAISMIIILFRKLLLGEIKELSLVIVASKENGEKEESLDDYFEGEINHFAVEADGKIFDVSGLTSKEEIIDKYASHYSDYRYGNYYIESVKRFN